MRERRYQPNRAARSLVAGRSFTIGLIVPNLKQPFLAEIAKAIASRIRALDYSLIIASSEEDPAIEQREVEGLIARQVDAIVLASEQTSADGVVFQRLAELQIPYVLVDRNFPGLDANYVCVDDVAVGRAATEHIIACGCQRITHLRGPEVSTGVRRLRRYRETLSRHRLEVPIEYVVELEGDDDRSEEHGYKAMKRLLGLKVPPDGVFSYNDEVAIGALRAILDAGLQVPDDITVIGVDNIRFADLLRVPLSGIDQNSYQIGERTARLALKLIESLKPLRSAQIVLPIQLVARDSTQARLVSGSYPKSVMALEALWMLDVVSQRGFRECAQHHVSTSSIPGNVEGAGFFDSLGRIDGSSERSELALETESVQASLKSREIGRARGLVGPRNDASRHHGR